MDQTEMMKLVAEKAVDTFVKDDMVVVLGTGRTATFAVKRLGYLLQSGLLHNVTGIPTSSKTSQTAMEVGIPLVTLEEVIMNNREVDIALDGADAVDRDLNLIKGGGGALFREYLTEMFAKELIIMVDENKLVKEHLLESFKLPIEIMNFGHLVTCKNICEKYSGSIISWELRTLNSGSTLYITENGNVIMDVLFKSVDLFKLYRELKMVHGVVCNGLFLNMTTKCLIARQDGTIDIVSK